MAYALKLDGNVIPLTGLIDPAVLIDGGRNTIMYEQDDAVREGVFKLFATNHSPESGARSLRDLLCCLPRLDAPGQLGYESISRVLIMQFIDAYSFDVRSVKKTCVHIVHPDGRLIPFDNYNLFYRDGLEQSRLAPLRQRAEHVFDGEACETRRYRGDDRPPDRLSVRHQRCVARARPENRRQPRRPDRTHGRHRIHLSSGGDLAGCDYRRAPRDGPAKRDNPVYRHRGDRRSACSQTSKYPHCGRHRCSGSGGLAPPRSTPISKRRTVVADPSSIPGISSRIERISAPTFPRSCRALPDDVQLHTEGV